MNAAPTRLNLTTPDALSIRVTRTFDAPRELVWRAYTDPALVAHWWGPREVTTVVDEMDVRVGGRWRYVQRGPDGAESSAFHGEYLEIDPPARCVSTFEFEGMPGHIVTDTVTLEEQGGKTRMTVSSRFATTADRDGMMASGMESGAAESYDRLADLLETLKCEADKLQGEPPIHLTRTFDAPRARVWAALTEAAQLEQWFGAKGSAIKVYSLDLRPQGRMFYSQQMGSSLMWGLWLYREIVAPERLVYVSAFADEAGNPARAPFSPTWPLTILNEWTLTEEAGRTTLTGRGRPVDATAEELATFASAAPMVTQGLYAMLDEFAAYLAR